MANFEYGEAIQPDNTIGGINLIELLKTISKNSLICTSNLGDGGNETIEKGLVNGHAYAFLGIEEMKLKDGSKIDIVRIRNPWGKTEWEGAWGDNDEKNWRR